MGQSSSRNRQQDQDHSTMPEPSSSGASTDITSSAASMHSLDRPRSSRDKHRSSFRRSLLNFVKQRPQEHRHSMSKLRPKSWRCSRRFSRPAMSPEVTAVQDKPEELLDDDSMEVLPHKAETSAGAFDGAGASEDNVNNQPTTETGSTSTSDSPSIVPATSQTTLDECPPEEIVVSPEQFLADEPQLRPITPVPDEAPQASSTPPPPENRHFPPPGTLVVVQGVVHTTDTPRLPDLSNEPPPSRLMRSSSTPPQSRTQDRSNSLRSRPSSMAAPSTTDINSLDTLNASTSAIPSDSASIPLTSDYNSTEQTSEASDNGHPNRSAISSSSIDVLGTLLSVAAAATAASLTGSEAMFPTGNVPLSAGSSSPLPTLPLSRPTSPTPTTGLGMGDDSVRGRRERMRHAWGSIRERLGFRPPGSPDGAPDDGSGSIDTPPSREQMISEMVRAFNLSLGLTSDALRSSSSPSQSPDSVIDEASVPSEPELPSEGSFERFLIDLQADLRIALTEPERQQQEPVSEDALVSLESHGSMPVQSHGAPEASEESEEGEDSVSVETDEDMPVLTPIDTHLPPFPDPPQPSGERWNLPTPPSTMPANPDSSGRVNWWRLYRFPPIAAPRQRTSTDTTNNTNNMPTNPSLSDDSASPTSESASHSSSTNSPSPSDIPTNSTDTPASSDSPLSPPNIVIPVIVVGLQSVNVNWQHNHPSAEAPLQPSDETLETGDSEPSIPLEGEERPETPRGRRWHSRATDVLRNLRPSSRQPDHNTPDPDIPGSRTFLIYVIGGYYPPEHSIVTGDGNSLDSFEALLELAELLGQVKPPTASADDIENSGLEVIKSTQLRQYESEGKISSNCIDNCLICLDDYQEEDDIRIMSCRHGFHKTCVDKWLQTGRNNCPACRSRGVVPDGATEV